MTEAPGQQAVVEKIDDPAYNPFWPKNMSGPFAPDAPAADHIVIDSITFGSPNTNVTINIHTIAAGQAWTVNWGDGTATDNVAAGTNLKAHTYADGSPGKAYTVQATCAGDTDTQIIEY